MRAIGEAPEGPRPTFQQSGPLREGAIYLTRSVDEQLPRALRKGELCYVVGPPGSGKSSLRVHTSRLLVGQGGRCATVDLSRMGQRVSAEGFYYALIGQIAEGLSLPDPTEFWMRREAASPVQRFAAYLRDELLSWLAQPIVVFIDGIDAARALGERSAALFDAIAGVYRDRDIDSSCKRLSFCLIGSSAPQDLALGPGRIPAELVHLFELSDFSAAEISPLRAGLADGAGDPQRLVQRVFHFSDGHPQLTQALCQALVHTAVPFGAAAGLPAGVIEDRRVDELATRPASGGHESDGAAEVLEAATRRFDALCATPQRGQAVSLYRRLLFGERVPAEAEDAVQRELRLCGMIKEYRDGAGHAWLRVRNRVFERAFGQEWLEERGHSGVLQAGLYRWLRSGKSPEHVLRGRDLDEVLSYTGPGHERTADEEEYLRAGLALRQEEELKETRAQLNEEQLLRGMERQQLRHERLVGLLVLATLLVGTSVETVVLQRRAERAAQGEQRALEQARVQQQLSDDRQEQTTRARQTAQHAIGRLIEASDAEHRAGADAEAGKLLEAELLGGGPGDLRERLDGLSAMGLAQQPEGRAAALLTAVRVTSVRQKAGQQPTVEAERGLYAAVSEALRGVGVEGLWPTLRGHLGYVRSVAFSPDGKLLVTASDDQTARLWDGRSGRPGPVLRGHGGLVRAAAFSPDSKLVATAGDDKTTRLWDAGSGQALATLSGHTADVRSVAFSPDGKLLVTTGGDGTARIWEARGGRLLAVLSGHDKDVLGAVFSHDGKQVATCSQDRTARIWQADSGKPVATLQGHGGPVVSVAFSPDDQRLLTASADGTARVWERSGRQLFTLSGHQQAVLAGTLSADGKYVVTAGQDHTARLWDAGTGAALAVLSGHQGPVLAAAFSPDGARVITTSQDHTARLWDRSGQLLVTLKGHSQGVLSAAFSPDGQTVATASADRTARLYPASLKRFLEVGCQLLKLMPMTKNEAEDHAKYAAAYCAQ